MDGPKLLVIASGLAAGLVAASRPAPDLLAHDGFVVICIPLATAAFVVLLDQWDKAVVRRARAAALATQPDPEWGISLLVDADEASGTLRPVVQLVGPQLPGDITVRLHVGDTNGEVGLISERRFTEPATKTDLVLGMLTVPDRVSVEKVALRDWVVAVSHAGREIARRCGPLSSAATDNDEAELQAPDLEVAPDEVEPPLPLPDPVRSVRLTIALSCAASGIAVGGYSLTTVSAWLWFVAVPLIVVAGTLTVAAALLFHTACPLCGRSTTIVGRHGAQRCDSCHQSFTLALV